MKKDRFIIGTRGSALALAQTKWVAEALKAHWGNACQFELKTITTKGDTLQKEASVSNKLDKGLFTKELELELEAEQIDIAVHSCKDLPTEISDKFKLTAFPKRVCAQDVLILKEEHSPRTLPRGAQIMTGSPRRIAQWLAAYPDTITLPIRGNIDTRLKKVFKDPAACGLILAKAGLERLQPSTEGFNVYPLDYSIMLPAPGQGALAIECRDNDGETRECLAVLNDVLTERQVNAERAFLQAMGGGCLAPVAAYAQPLYGDGTLRLSGMAMHEGRIWRHNVTGAASEPEVLGQLLAEGLLSMR